MKILKTMLAIEGTNQITTCDTIEYEGRLWLVPEWLDAPSEGWSTPARLVLLFAFRHQETPNRPDSDYLINEPVPMSVLEGKPTPTQAKQFPTIERPPIRIEVGRA